MSSTATASAPCLRDWQRTFQASVAGLDPDTLVTRHIADPCGIGAPQRLDVYVQAYVLRLLEILQDDYPGLCKTLGDARFEALARAYIAAQPSSTHSVRWFGRDFSTFLRSRRTRPAWAAELAAFEWAVAAVLDSADAVPMSMQAMAEIPAGQWPQQTLRLVPSLRLLRLAWNVPALLQASETEPASRVTPLHGAHASWWLIWRHQYQARWRRLAKPEAWALRAVQRGEALANVGSTLQRAGVPRGQVPAQLVTCLQQWLGDGLICAPGQGAQGLVQLP